MPVQYCLVAVHNPIRQRRNQTCTARNGNTRNSTLPWLMGPASLMPHSQGPSDILYPESNQLNSSYWYPQGSILLHGLWNPEVQCRIQKGRPIFSILSRINSIPRTNTNKKVHSFMAYETLRFNAAFTGTLQYSLPWVESIQFLVSIFIYLRSILIHCLLI